jgi:hypothetical protein
MADESVNVTAHNEADDKAAQMFQVVVNAAMAGWREEIFHTVLLHGTGPAVVQEMTEKIVVQNIPIEKWVDPKARS